MKLAISIIGALILIVGSTVGAMEYFATKGELELVAVKSECGDVQYEIDKTMARMWKIEDRYNGSNDYRVMKSHDGRNYLQLQMYLKKLLDYQKSKGCVGSL